MSSAAGFDWLKTFTDTGNTYSSLVYFEDSPGSGASTAWTSSYQSFDFSVELTGPGRLVPLQIRVTTSALVVSVINKYYLVFYDIAIPQ